MTILGHFWFIFGHKSKICQTNTHYLRKKFLTKKRKLYPAYFLKKKFITRLFFNKKLELFFWHFTYIFHWFYRFLLFFKRIFLLIYQEKWCAQNVLPLLGNWFGLIGSRMKITQQQMPVDALAKKKVKFFFFFFFFFFKI